MKRNSKIKLPASIITRAISVHVLASCLESYATDCKDEKLVEMSKKIRNNADKYEEEFGAVADMFYSAVKQFQYDKHDVKNTLCFLVWNEAKKLHEEYLRINPERPGFDDIEIAREIDLHKSYAVGKIISDIKALTLSLRAGLKDKFKQLNQ